MQELEVYWCLWYDLTDLKSVINLPVQVSTAAKAREVAADARFPPLGRRGFGSPFTHATWGVTTKEYLDSANENVLVIVQIENHEAVQNIDEIAAVSGIGET